MFYRVGGWVFIFFVQRGFVWLFTLKDMNDWGSAAQCLSLLHYARPDVAMAYIDRPPSGVLADRLRTARRVFLYTSEREDVGRYVAKEQLRYIGSWPNAGIVFEVSEPNETRAFE